MSVFRQGWQYLLLLLVLIVFLVTASFSLVGAHEDSIHTAKELARERFLAHNFQPKQERLERAFATMYEAARTISLLPSVRAIQGGNRTSEDEDVVADGRFSEDAWVTVQQIYNNLATNLDVSEIYCVLEGFDPEGGEVPFFMFDSLVIQRADEERVSEEGVDPDLSEESEEEEYAYYLKQISYFKEYFPELQLD